MNRDWFASVRKLALLFAAAMLLPVPVMAAAKREPPLTARLKTHIEVLASDAFEGREPGTEGEAKTLRYLGQRWFEIGLVSGTNDPGNPWFAPVTLVAREPAASTAQFNLRGRRVYFPQRDALILTSGQRSLISNAPLLFVGKGEGPPPQRNDLAGRVAVMLDSDMADGRLQNALLDAGASAVLTVLDGDRTLENVEARRRRTGYALVDDKPGGDLEGFLTRQGMERLLLGSGFTLAGLEKLAAAKDFVPLALPLNATLEATSKETRIQTHNVIGKIVGKKPLSGSVLFMAHWDHFGQCGEVTAENRICNGAVDNASGLASLTEIARLLARDKRLDRDVYFLATTGEELGLLGAHAFTENPPLPLGQIVAAFNIDSNAIAPAGTPLAIVGKGMTALDDEIAKVAKKEKRVLLPSEAGNAYVRRQDGWALLQHDVPAVMVTSAYADITRIERFFDGDYHRPSDDLNKPIELGGAAEDVTFHVALARWFGDAGRVELPKK